MNRRSASSPLPPPPTDAAGATVAESRTASAPPRQLWGILLWWRPPSRLDVWSAHLPLASLTGIALAVAFFTVPQQLPLMPCHFRHWTGYPCPFCGLTRAFYAIADGEWLAVWLDCPLGIAVFMGTTAIFLWHIIAILAGVRLARGPLLQVRGRWRWFCGFAVGLIILANWLYRLLSGCA